MSAEDFKPTDAQTRVIDHDGSAFINACPGAGKTRVMVERATGLLRQRKNGQGIAFMSFTEAAVSELEHRLRARNVLPTPTFPNFVGTFDSFVWQYIVAPCGFTDLGKPPRVIADLGEIEISFHENARSLPLSAFDPATHEIDADAAKRKGFDVAGEEQWKIDRYKNCARAIRKRHDARGEVGFDGIRIHANRLLGNAEFSGRLAKALSCRFEEIIVDEAQDCNPEDLEIVNWLMDAGIPTKIICDPHQAIYSFRGGLTGHLDDVCDGFEKENRLTLMGNFRSSSVICKAVSMLRPACARDQAIEALGKHKDFKSDIVVISYGGASVPDTVGERFTELVECHGFDPDACPVLASTRESGAKAVGQRIGRQTGKKSVRLASAVCEFHHSFEIGGVSKALQKAHAVILEVEGHLEGITYHQFMSGEANQTMDWRPSVLGIVSELRWNTEKYKSAREWHTRAKELLKPRLLPGVGTISKRMCWSEEIENVLTARTTGRVSATTIHAVKGKQFPAVCVVTTTKSLGNILDFLEEGEKPESAEEARKLYVAASRAEKVLAFAVPKSKRGRFIKHLGVQGATCKVIEA